MTRLALLLGLSILMLTLFAALIQGQDKQMTGPMMGPMMMGPDASKAQTTINGTVEKIELPWSEAMHHMGLRLIIKSVNESLTVHLGPAAFVEKTMTFKEGDTVEIVATKLPMMGDTTYMAREVKKGDEVLKLRDEHGMPLWPMHGMHGRHS